MAFYDECVGGLISEKYALPEKAAIKSFLLSETYRMLMDTETEFYKVSPYILFDMRENEEITEEPGNSQYTRENRAMGKKSDFFVYLLEQYAVYKKTTADKVLEVLEEENSTDFMHNMYDVYHTEILDNAFMDLNSLVETGRPAW